MKNRIWLGLVAAALTLYGGRLAWRAHRDIVTLNVHQAPLADVVKRLRWQTWEPIYVGKEVEGTVTLRVKNQPLEVVLNILNEQVNGRWTAVYPLYTSRKSLRTARALARGEIEAPAVGWTNWSARPRGPGGFPGGRPADASEATGGAPQFAGFRPGGDAPGAGRLGFGVSLDGASSTSVRVNLDLKSATPFEAAQSLRRQSGARVVPEDGTKLPVTLAAEGLSLDDAVAAVAKKLFRKWTRFYVFEGRRMGPPESRGEVAATEPRPERPQPTDEQRQQMEQVRAQMAADPARQEAAANRMLAGLLNSTPQQRTERDAMRLARQRSRAARQ